MRTRAFGRTGWQVGEIGLGCSHVGGSVFYDDDDASMRLLAHALDRGVNFYDTANTYAFGHSEELLGRAFAGRRDDVVISTKVGMLPSTLAAAGKPAIPLLRPMRALLRPMKRALKRFSARRQDFSPAHIRASAEASLRRLKTDRIDLYLLHSPPREVLRRGEAVETVRRLVAEGKVRFYGVSAFSVEDALLCLEDPELAAVQVVYNVFETEAARALLPRAAERGVAVIARVPLARGLLTPDLRVKSGSALADRSERRAGRADIEAAAPELTRPDRTLLQAALQFAVHPPEVSVAIPGTRSTTHLDEILDAAKAPPLDDRALAALRRLGAAAR